MVEINKLLTPYNYTRMYGRKIEYIVIHYVGAVSSAENNAIHFAKEPAKGSTHYFVDSSSIWQAVLDENKSWHCGGGLQGSGGHTFFGKCTNSNSIGIEMCCYIKSGKWCFAAKTVENTVELVRFLMDKYKIPIEKVIRHYDVTGKLCPEPYVDEKKWAEFKGKITKGDKLTMTQYEELKKENKALKEKIKDLEAQNKVYHYWDELPEYAEPVIRELYDKGIYKGNGASDLNLPEVLMRTLVINYRAGLYKEV